MIKTYDDFVKQCFYDHETDIGIMDEEEVADTLADYPPKQIERWLVRCGYNVNDMYTEYRRITKPERGEF